MRACTVPAGAERSAAALGCVSVVLRCSAAAAACCLVAVVGCCSCRAASR
jgi:hypothetical protein